MKIEEYISAIRTMQHFSFCVMGFYPDQYKFVCQQHDIPEREAMDMYSYLCKIADGCYWVFKDKPEGYLYTMLSMAQEANKLQSYNNFINDTAAVGDKKSKILVVFSKDGKYIPEEFDLQMQVSFIKIAEMVKNGYTMIATARQVDNIDGKQYAREVKDKRDYIPIYDGDVMLCYVDKPEYGDSDYKNSGLYLCKDGVYHRLIYTPGKGYIRHGKPDTDEDFELDIEDKSFSSYVMSLSQKWYKLGNIYAGIGFLIEKSEDKEK